MSCMLECSPCGVLSFCAWFVSVYLCVCTRTCVCVYIRLQNLCFALKDKEGGPGSQSVPLQINSLIPGSVFSPKHPLSPASASLCLSLPPLRGFITLSSSSLIASVYSRSFSCSLSIRDLHGLLWICVGEWWICSWRRCRDAPPFWVNSLGL